MSANSCAGALAVDGPATMARMSATDASPAPPSARGWAFARAARTALRMAVDTSDGSFPLAARASKRSPSAGMPSASGACHSVKAIAAALSADERAMPAAVRTCVR